MGFKANADQVAMQALAKRTHRYLLFMLLLMLSVWSIPTAQAHLMVAQRGSINFVDSGAFMVLSLPVSAFKAIDNNANNRLSVTEFDQHQDAIKAMVIENVILQNKLQHLPLQGLMISPSWPEDKQSQILADQIVVMGRFNLASDGTAESTTLNKDYRFSINLFGQKNSERQFQITVTHANSENSQLLLLSPKNNASAISPSETELFFNYFKLGLLHVVKGWDHILFLLLALAVSLHWRHVASTLTLFTIGHAISLYFSVTGVISVPAYLLEPTIIATIVAIAFFDYYRRNSRRILSARLRHALVFGCALIHGLGFASALVELGFNKAQLLPGLLGFNLGIELSQLSIALLLILFYQLIGPYLGADRSKSDYRRDLAI